MNTPSGDGEEVGEIVRGCRLAQQGADAEDLLQRSQEGAVGQPLGAGVPGPGQRREGDHADGSVAALAFVPGDEEDAVLAVRLRLLDAWHPGGEPLFAEPLRL